MLIDGKLLKSTLSIYLTEIYCVFQVVVCNCVVDLHEYIDKNQLTEDLDGCIAYHHEEWIDQRVVSDNIAKGYEHHCIIGSNCSKNWIKLHSWFVNFFLFYLVKVLLIFFHNFLCRFSLFSSFFFFVNMNYGTLIE